MDINTNDFAAKYAECGDSYEAAVFAGAKRGLEAKITGVKLLFNGTVRNRIASLRDKMSPCPAEQAVRHIAFGRINDAVRLAFTAEVTPNLVDTLDLSCVSELKVGKGTIEIKFIDRLKALEKLAEIEQKRADKDDGCDLIRAVYGSQEDDD